jgi:hypothetical protein
LAFEALARAKWNDCLGELPPRWLYGNVDGEVRAITSSSVGNDMGYSGRGIATQSGDTLRPVFARCRAPDLLYQPTPILAPIPE